MHLLRSFHFIRKQKPNDSFNTFIKRNFCNAKPAKQEQEAYQPQKPSAFDVLFCVAMLGGLCYYIKPPNPPPVNPPYYLLTNQNDMDQLV